MLTEFQRRHVDYPPLRPDMLRTVWCRVFDEQGRPMSRHGRPFTTRLFLEVAECTHKRGPVWGVRKQASSLFGSRDQLQEALADLSPDEVRELLSTLRSHRSAA
jgi:hypothetical protein